MFFAIMIYLKIIIEISADLLDKTANNQGNSGYLQANTFCVASLYIPWSWVHECQISNVES